MIKSLYTGNTAMRALKGARTLSSTPVTVVSGRGGRSSTSSHTVTVFGATGRMGLYLVNNLGQIGTQLIIPHRCDPFTAQNLKVLLYVISELGYYFLPASCYIYCSNAW